MTVKGFKSVYPMQCMRLIICCGMAVMRLGMFGISMRKKKAMTGYEDNDTDWKR
jgi:hypothetical protein